MVPRIECESSVLPSPNAPVLLPPTLRSQRRSIIRVLRGIVLAVFCLSVISGCERPDIVDTEGRNFAAQPGDGLSLELVDASFRIDGRLRTERINLSTEQFVFLFVFVKSKGLYIISAEEMSGMGSAGRFDGPRLSIIVAGTVIEFESSAGNLLGREPDRIAWVEYRPDYDLLGPDARPGDAVIGLANRKEMIPGFAENNGS